MRIPDETHTKVERFLREHRGDPHLSLPPIFVHGGAFAKLLMKVVGKGAITFGRHVFVTPSLLERDAAGREAMPDWLLVHEAAHVLQYKEKGFARFLRDYLLGYWRALRAGGSWDARGRLAAYLAIEAEREAHAAERAFLNAGRTFGGESGADGAQEPPRSA